MKYFICSMANDGRKNIVPLLTDSIGQLEKFAEDHDQPGRAVYACVNPLRGDATARVKDQVEAIVTLHIDIDFKRLATPPDEVRRKIMELPLPFEVRESGGGLHVLANLKEAYENGTEHFRRAEELRTQLMTLMGGDPAPNHSAALLRVVGSHNSKYGEPVEVSVTRAGEPVDIVDVEAFLDLYTEPLFELKDGYLPTSNVVSLDVPFVPIDTDAVLGDMPSTGEGVNAVQYRLLRALIVREGMTPQEAVDAVVGATMTMAAAHQPDWTFDVEFKCVTARMKWVLGRLEKEHWAAVEAGRRAADEPPDWLPPDWRAPWTAGHKAGGTPHVHRNGHGYCIRTAGATKADAAPEPEGASTAANDTAEQPRERHYRFRLVDFEDMIPDEVSHYLVDELLPEKGIGMVWGKPKCLKSFCVLDICFHIARGWPYHDRAVKQGGVVYCAFEGGYGYKKRVAALRAHYHLEGEPKGATDLKIVPSSAPNLVKDHTQLVRELTEQLAGVMPRVVVLDTLNKSISGSESKDEDMAAYIRAAESIRNAFDCLVIIVHHCGWDESRPRGHSSLPGAVDVQIRIERNEQSGTLTATVELMRDGPEGGQVHLRAEEIVVGYDKKNHKDLTSLVLVADDAPAPGAPGKKRGRPDIHTPVFLKALSDCIGRGGRNFIPDGVDTVRAVELNRVAAEFHRRYVASGDPDKAREAERKTFDWCVTKAREEGRIQVMRDASDIPLVWFTRRGERTL